MQQPQMNPQDLLIGKLFNISGKVALITGATGALGSAIAKGLAINGASLVLTSIEAEALNNLAEEFKAQDISVLPIHCDVTQEEAVEEMVAKAVECFGKVDILVNCAGMAHRELLMDQSLEDWQRIMDVNVKGILLCCKAVARDMIKRGEGGSIINIGSVRGFHAHKDGYTSYGTSKAAVHYMTKTLAFEWAEHDIRVNGIAPCMFWSDLTRPVLSDPEKAKLYLERIPLQRAPIPEEFVGAAIYLASSASSMVTAHILSVDGGVTGG